MSANNSWINRGCTGLYFRDITARGADPERAQDLGAPINDKRATDNTIAAQIEVALGAEVAACVDTVTQVTRLGIVCVNLVGITGGDVVILCLEDLGVGVDKAIEECLIVEHTNQHAGYTGIDARVQSLTIFAEHTARRAGRGIGTANAAERTCGYKLTTGKIRAGSICVEITIERVDGHVGAAGGASDRAGGCIGRSYG